MTLLLVDDASFLVVFRGPGAPSDFSGVCTSTCVRLRMVHRAPWEGKPERNCTLGLMTRKLWLLDKACRGRTGIGTGFIRAPQALWGCREPRRSIVLKLEYQRRAGTPGLSPDGQWQLCVPLFPYSRLCVGVTVKGAGGHTAGIVSTLAPCRLPRFLASSSVPS